jgi:hypothetical protein
MSFLGWMALGGGVLLLTALSSAYLRSLPVSTSAIYLTIGAAIGPLGAAGCGSTSARRCRGSSG